MPIGAILSKIMGTSVIDAADKVANIADRFIQTKDEKAAYQIELLKVKADIEQKANELEASVNEAYLKDTQSARDSYTRIQESINAGWLSKNIMSILTIAVTLGFFGLLGYMLKFDVPKENKDILNIMLGSLGTAWITIIAFFFGSSKGSEDKSKQIHTMINDK